MPSIVFFIGILLAGFYLLVFRFTRGALRADGERLTSSYQSSLQVAQEGLGGIRDVLLDRSQHFFLEAYQERTLSYRLAGAAINIKAQVPRYMIEGFTMILIVGLSLSLAVSGQGIEQQLPLLVRLVLERLLFFLRHLRQFELQQQRQQLQPEHFLQVSVLVPRLQII